MCRCQSVFPRWTGIKPKHPREGGKFKVSPNFAPKTHPITHFWHERVASNSYYLSTPNPLPYQGGRTSEGWRSPQQVEITYSTWSGRGVISHNLFSVELRKWMKWEWVLTHQAGDDIEHIIFITVLKRARFPYNFENVDIDKTFCIIFWWIE